jgi:hypothetical protein
MPTTDTRVGVFLRVPQGLHKRLIEAAGRNLRSSNKEAVYRLQQTFALDDEPADDAPGVITSGPAA